MSKTVKFSRSLRDELLGVLSDEKLFSLRTIERLSDAAARDYDIDSAESPDDMLSFRQFCATYLSALLSPNTDEALTGFGEDYVTKLSFEGDLPRLTALTNYVLKPLAIHALRLSEANDRKVIAINHRLHSFANRKIHALRSSSDDYGSVRPEVDAVLSEVHLSGERVHFLFLTKEYLENFFEWLEVYTTRSRMPGRLLIMTIGEGVDAEVRQRVATTELGDAQIVHLALSRPLSVCGNGNDLRFLWYVKVYVVNHLLKNENDVTYTDLDSYWLGDVEATWDRLRQNSAADMAFMLTGDLPLHGVHKWGFVPCAGFFCAAPTPGAREFVGEWLRTTEIMFDDQIGLFELLSEHANWSGSADRLIETSATFTLGHHPVKVAIFKRDVAVRSFAISLLDAARELNRVRGCAVWHPRWVVAPDVHSELLTLLTAIARGRETGNG